MDAHVPDLFVFCPDHAIHSDDAYIQGKMIAQDKASCFPALVLDPPTLDDACVIDATAAPGNKVSNRLLSVTLNLSLCRRHRTSAH